MPQTSLFHKFLGASILRLSVFKVAALFCLTTSLILVCLSPTPAQINPVVPNPRVSALQEITVTPPNPQLGATIAVVVNSAQVPTIKFADKPYPAFRYGTNLWRSLIPTTPLDTPGVKNLTISVGTEIKTISTVLGDRDFPTQRIWLPARDEDAPLDEYEFDRVDEFKALITPEKHWQGALLRPTSGDLTSGYGVRRYYNGVFAEDYFHRGLDYGAGVGTPVIAPAAGRIALIGRADQRFNIHGNVVGIDHGQGLLSIMLHLSRIDVREGDFVQAGQAIARSGATGAVTGPHLHWGLFLHGSAIDPVPWREGDFN